MFNLCAYKDIFGKPNEGVHAKRIGPFALIDTVGTLLAAVLISYIFSINFFIVLTVLVLLGIFFHWAFCVKTSMLKMLGISS